MIDADDCAKCKKVFEPGAVKARYRGDSVLCTKCSYQWAAVVGTATNRLFQEWLVSDDAIICPLCKVGEVGYSRVEDSIWHMKCHSCGTLNPHLVSARKAIESGKGFRLTLLSGLPGKAFEHTVAKLAEEYPDACVRFDPPDKPEPF